MMELVKEDQLEKVLLSTLEMNFILVKTPGLQKKRMVGKKYMQKMQQEMQFQLITQMEQNY